MSAERHQPEFFPPVPCPHGAGFTIDFVSSLKPWQGLTILLRAFAHLREVDADVRLLLGGDHVEREATLGFYDLMTLNKNLVLCDKYVA